MENIDEKFVQKIDLYHRNKIVGFSCIFLQSPHHVGMMKFSEMLGEHARLLSMSECC